MTSHDNSPSGPAAGADLTHDELQAALTLQIAFGADEAITETTIDRLAKKLAADPSNAGDTASRTVAAPTTDTPRQRPSTDPRAAQAPLGTDEAVKQAKALASAALDLDALKTALESFDGCSLTKTAENLVFEDGNRQAKLMLIGDVPGAEEDQGGKPFMGPNGALLDKMLAAIDLSRDSLYATNMIYWRPPGNRSATEGEVAICMPFLQRQIQLVAPKIILLVGARPTKALLAKPESLGKLRGRWETLSLTDAGLEIHAMPFLHPGYLRRNPDQKQNAWKDLLTLKRKCAELGLKT